MKKYDLKKIEKKVMAIFLEGGDNRSKVIADKLGINKQKVDKVIRDYYQKKMDKKNQIIDEINEYNDW